MTGATWEEVAPAAAFVLGAFLATVAVLRVVRAVAFMFGAEVRRTHRRRRGGSDESGG